MTKRVIIIAVALVVVTAAVIIQQRVQHARMWMQAIDHARVLLDEANARYYAQDDQEAAVALTRLLEHLESVTPVTDPWAPPSHPFLNAQQLALDRALATSRLAIVQERLGQHDAATSWARAESHARAANAGTLNAESLRALVQKMDESARQSPAPAQ